MSLEFCYVVVSFSVVNPYVNVCQQSNVIQSGQDLIRSRSHRACQNIGITLSDNIDVPHDIVTILTDLENIGNPFSGYCAPP